MDKTLRWLEDICSVSSPLRPFNREDTDKCTLTVKEYS